MLCPSRNTPSILLEGLAHFLTQSTPLPTSLPGDLGALAGSRTVILLVIRFSVTVKVATTVYYSFLHVKQKQKAITNFWYFCKLSNVSLFIIFMSDEVI